MKRKVPDQTMQTRLEDLVARIREGASRRRAAILDEVAAKGGPSARPDGSSTEVARGATGSIVDLICAIVERQREDRPRLDALDAAVKAGSQRDAKASEAIDRLALRVASGAKMGEGLAEGLARIGDDLDELRRAVADEFGIAKRRQVEGQRRTSRRIREMTRAIADLSEAVERLTPKGGTGSEDVQAEKGRASTPMSGAAPIKGRRGGVER